MEGKQGEQQNERWMRGSKDNMEELTRLNGRGKERKNADTARTSSRKKTNSLSPPESESKYMLRLLPGLAQPTLKAFFPSPLSLRNEKLLLKK